MKPAFLLLLVVHAPPPKDDAAAVAVLQKMGVELFRDGKQASRPVVRAVVLPRPGAGPGAVLPRLAGLPQLRELSMNDAHGLAAKDFVHLEKTTALVGLELNRAAVPDEGLASIGKLAKLERLLLRTCKAKSAAFKHLAGLKELRTLDLGSCAGLDDKALAHLEGLSKLETLLLPEAKITDAGLASIAKLSSLRTLDLGGIALGDAGVKKLAALKELRSLVLADSKVTDDALEALAGLPLAALDLTRTKAVGKPLAKMRKLLEVKLRETPVTDETLAALAEVPYLRTLDLAFTDIGDAALAKLAERKTLRRLDLWKTKVTSAGLAHLEGLPVLEKVVVVVVEGGDPAKSVTPGAVEKLKAANKGVQVDD
ncbi:MAG: hypothetical protein K2W96_00995 [Gemmataceae bacterium]|nr:hypothetical protein [Gemmataceae bacterium]